MLQHQHHQIVQSPARLGLTSPSSPSLQNPAQPKPQPSTSHHQTPVPTLTSSLLPPLPRAQALLLHMSNLASKLFDLSPNRSLWLSSFRGSLPSFLQTQTQTQTQTLASPLPTPSSNKQLLSLFASLQTQLFDAVSELQQMLDLQNAILRLSMQVKSYDSSLLNFSHKLKHAERLLDILVDDYSDYRNPNTAFDGSRIKLSDILSYAHRISYTTYAPPEFGAGLGPLRGALPPAPQEEQMRASHLYNFAHLDVGLPKPTDTKERTIEAILEPPTKDPDLGRLVGLLPPNITIPSGWKPGMPVELPKDLPVPPPGWKPGDPLPPLEAIPMPRVLEQQPVDVPPRGLHKPPGPEPIQVRHVQLDILDQDDDSSDYSSDEASSDDDD